MRTFILLVAVFFSTLAFAGTAQAPDNAAQPVVSSFNLGKWLVPNPRIWN